MNDPSLNLSAGPIDPIVLADAERRWEQLAAANPSLRNAIDLQRVLVSRSIQLFETIRTTGWPRGSLSPLGLDTGRLQSKLERGVPLLRGEDVALPVEPLTDALLAFCRALEAYGAGPSAAHIGQAIESKRLDAGSLLKASLARADCDIRNGSIQLGLAPDLLWLTAELAVSPYAYFLERSLAAILPDEALSTWDRGYCPFCGSWPALAERRAGRRIPRCSLCAASWGMGDHRCIYCSERGEGFSVATLDTGHPDDQLETCRTCEGYLKVLVRSAAIEFPLIAVEDLATTDLDSAAMAGGFRRPPLKKIG